MVGPPRIRGRQGKSSTDIDQLRKQFNKFNGYKGTLDVEMIQRGMKEEQVYPKRSAHFCSLSLVNALENLVLSGTTRQEIHRQISKKKIDEGERDWGERSSNLPQ
jgi:hypothetical protein